MENEKDICMWYTLLNKPNGTTGPDMQAAPENLPDLIAHRCMKCSGSDITCKPYSQMKEEGSCHL